MVNVIYYGGIAVMEEHVGYKEGGGGELSPTGGEGRRHPFNVRPKVASIIKKKGESLASGTVSRK